MRPKTIGLIAHTGKAAALELIPELGREFAAAGVRVILEDITSEACQLKDGQPLAQLAKAADLLVVLGGDGTILNVVARLGTELKPIFGINVGSLGFLTCAGSTGRKETVASIAQGKISFSRRTLLEIQLRNPGAEPVTSIAMNDVVISRGEISRLVRLRTTVDGEVLTEFNADGLIIATPTGSTAYSLSAGGPILEPRSGVFVITPICPHVLTNRSLIVSDDAEIVVEAIERSYPVFLTVDGRDPVAVETGGTITMRKSTQHLELAVLPDVSFFSVLRHKLKWTGSNV